MLLSPVFVAFDIPKTAKGINKTSATNAIIGTACWFHIHMRR